MKFSKVILKCLAALLCAVSLASCSGNGLLSPSVPNLNKQLALTARITTDGGSFTADFARSNIGKWQVTLTEPYEVQGISFTCDQGSFSASLGDLTADVLTADFAASPPALIISAFENAVKDSAAAVSYQKETFTVQSGDCTLTFRQGSPAPIAMELPTLKVEITDFRITGEIFPEGADVVVGE